MNKLYLLLPVAEKVQDESLRLLLKEAQFKNGREALDYFKNIYQVIDNFGYEDFEGVYDSEQLRNLFDKISSDKQLSKESPSPIIMKKILERWSDFHDDYDGNHSFLLFGTTEVKDTIFNAYMRNDDAGSVTFINKDASLYLDNELERHTSGDVIPVKMLPMDFKAIYEWFVEYRNPQREFDDNYNKHGERSKLGKRGLISPLTYKSKEEIKGFLIKAIGTKDGGAKQLFFYDKAKGKYLYFWNENTPNLLYHAYEVSTDNMNEINKMLHKGGRALKDLVDELGNE